MDTAGDRESLGEPIFDLKYRETCLSSDGRSQGFYCRRIPQTDD